MKPFAILAGLSFLAMLASRMWPKACLTKFQEQMRGRGEDPNARFGKEKMMQLDPDLYRRWKIGFAVSSIFSLCFIVFALLAFWK